MTKALITGVTGQDGFYLSEFLQAKGYEVHGLVRRNSRHLYDAPPGCLLHYGDLIDPGRLRSIIAEVRPDELYNLAAQSHVRVSFEMPEYTSQVNGSGFVSLLDAVRELSPETRIYQASTSEMFGASPPPQSEASKFLPQSPYACAKVYAYLQGINYREAYGLFVCNGIMFNHESPRRGLNFVTRKIAQAAARISLGRQDVLQLGRLDTYRDWGWAPEYVRAMWLMLQNAPDDYVVATGESHSVEEFVDLAFRCVDLDWKKYVVHGVEEDRPADVPFLRGDATKIERVLGWKATVRFAEIVRNMVMFEVQQQKGGK